MSPHANKWAYTVTVVDVEGEVFCFTQKTTRKSLFFFSRRYTPHEQRLYSSLELETLNCLDVLEKVKYYIDSGFSLTLYTDAKALTWLIASSRVSTNLKLSRMVVKLQQFPIKLNISYVKPDIAGPSMCGRHQPAI